MKKLFVLFIISLIMVSFAGAQILMQTYSMPDSLKTNNGILYFKFIPKKLDSIAGVPYVGLGDATICLSKDTFTTDLGWGFYSCQIRTTRKSNSGYIDIRDQGNTAAGSFNNYLAIDEVIWEYDTAYHCWIDIDYSSMTYSVYVLKVGDDITNQKIIGETAAFRNQTTELNLINILNSNNYSTDSILLIQQVSTISTLPVDSSIIPVDTTQTGVSKLIAKASGLFYPNPAKNLITVNYDLDITGKVKVTINNISGKDIMVLANAVESAGKHQITAKIDGLKSGIYLVKLQSGNYLRVEKLIIK